MDVIQPVIQAAFLALVVERFVAGFVTPIFDKFGWDKFILLYVAWVLGGVLVFVAEVNLFAAYIPNVMLGRILSGAISGGGANLIHDLFDSK